MSPEASVGVGDLLTPAGGVASAPPKIEDGVVLSFTIYRHVLAKALARIEPVVANTDLQPILTNFGFRLEGNDLRITGSDSILSAVVHIATNSGGSGGQVEGEALFPANRMIRVVREAAADELTITVKSKNQKMFAQVRSGKARWEFPLMALQSGQSFLDFSTAEHTDLDTVDRGTFLIALNQVRKAVSADVMRPYLMLVDISQGRMRASDSVRFQQVDFDFPFDCQIPARAVQEIAARLANAPVESIGVGQTHRALLFRFGRVLLICQKSAANFPNVDEVLLKPAFTNDQEFVVNRKALLEAVRRVRITADEDTSAVVLSLNDGSVSVECKDRRGGYSVETIEATWTHSPRHISFNHQHLTDLLSSAPDDGENCTFRLGKDLKTKPTPLLIEDKYSGFTAVLSQIRLDWL